jgi:hypothetical protein
MIIVRVELHSVITGQVTEIARMGIANTGGNRARGHYFAETYRGRSAKQLAKRERVRAGSVRDYPRLSIHVWHLVARALIAMGYAGAAERAQPTDLLDVIDGSVPGQRTP